MNQRLRQVVQTASESFVRRKWFAALMQYGRFFVEILAIAVLLIYLWQANVSWVVMALAVPLAAGVLDLFVRWLCRAYVEKFRADVIRQQRDDAMEALQKAYVDQLILLPRDVGRTLHELSDVAERIPAELARQSGAPAE